MDPLIVDVYEGDGAKNWNALASAGAPWSGAIIKATQGTYYSGGTWFGGQWRLVELAGAHSARTDWLRGAYHYIDVVQSPDAQAEFFLKALARAGGFGPRDVFVVDVERAGQRTSVTARQVIDCVSRFVERIRQLTGKWVMLYGGSWLYDLGITDRMGCRWLYIARYTETLPAQVYQRIGWDLASLALWQYCGLSGGGKVDSLLHGYPSTTPIGPMDISALVLKGGASALIAG